MQKFYWMKYKAVKELRSWANRHLHSNGGLPEEGLLITVLVIQGYILPISERMVMNVTFYCESMGIRK